MNKILILSLITLAFSYKECDEIYKCLDESNMPQVNHTAHELCEWKQRPRNGTGPDIVYVRRCKDGYECDDLSDDEDRRTNSDSDGGDYNDEYEYCFPATPKSIAGETCINNNECHSGNCVNGKCEPVADGNTCNNHGSCGKHSFCNKNRVCQRLLNPDDLCSDDVECPFGYICSRNNIDSRKCLMMYSVPTGQHVDDEELCESGEEENNICVDVRTNVTQDGKEYLKKCTKDSDCPIDIVANGQTRRGEGECECTHEGNTYCELGSDSSQWQRFLKVFREQVNNYKEGDIHVAVHRENNWNVIPLLYEAQLLTDVENVDMPACAIEFMINSTSSLASSGYLKVGAVFVLSIIGLFF